MENPARANAVLGTITLVITNAAPTASIFAILAGVASTVTNVSEQVHPIGTSKMAAAPSISRLNIDLGKFVAVR